MNGLNHLFAPNGRRLPVWILFLVSLTALQHVRGQNVRLPGNPDEPTKVRTLYVPFEQLKILFEGSSQHVYLTRKEYDDLMARALTKPAPKPPRSVVFHSVVNSVSVSGEIAKISSKLMVEILEDGIHAVPVRFGNLSLQSATLKDGSRAALGFNKNRETILFLNGKGRHEIEFTFASLVKLETARQTVSFQLPSATQNRLTVTVDGNIELASGAAVISRAYDAASNRTTFELVPSRAAMSLLMSVNNKKIHEQKSILAKSVFIHELTSNYEQIHARINVDILHGETDSVRFELPSGFQITDVTCAPMSNWSIEKEGERSELVVHLREAVGQGFTLNIAATSTEATAENWTLRKLRPVGFSGSVSVVGIVAEERFELQALKTEGLFPINNTQIESSIPDTVFKTAAGAPPIATVAAFYAPDSNFTLQARFTVPPASLELSPTSILILSDRMQKLIGQYQLTARHEKVVDFDLLVPSGWRMVTLKGPDGKPLEFQRIAAADGTRLNARIPGGLPAGNSFSIVFEATRTDASWSTRWDRIDIPFPRFEVGNSEFRTGAIAVAVEDDLTVRASATNSLEPLLRDQKAIFGLNQFETALAMEIVDGNYSATLAVERLQSRVTATAFNFFRLLNKKLAAHYEITFDIRSARARKLTLVLPKSTPSEVRIQGLSGASLAQTDSAEQDDTRKWTIELQEPTLGEVRVGVDFVMNLPEDELQDFSLPLIQAESVGYQTTLLAFEGNPDFDIEIDTNMREVDAGELGDADYAPGPRLLGAYSAIGTDPRFSMDVSRRNIHRLPEAIIQDARLKTIVSKNGKSQSVAVFEIVTKVPFLELQLPENAELWAVQVDGVPTRPQLAEGAVLISLPPDARRPIRNLIVFYEDPIGKISLTGSIDMHAPMLRTRNTKAGESIEVPQTGMTWEVTLPSGYDVTANSGTVFLNRQHSKPLPMVGLLTPLAPFSLLLPAVQAARQATRKAVESDMRGGVDFEDESFAFEDRGVERAFGAELESEMALDEARGDAPAGTAAGGEAKSEAPPDSDPFAPSDMKKTEAQNSAPVKLPPSASKNKGKAIAQSGEEGRIEKFRQLQNWAKKGISGLTVSESTLNPNDDDQTFLFESLGDQPRISVTVVDQDRVDWLGFSAAFIVFSIGLFLTRASWRTRIGYVSLILLVAGIVPMLGTWTEFLWPALTLSVISAMLLIMFWPAHSVLVRWMGYGLALFRWLTGSLTGTTPGRRIASLALILLLSTASMATAWQDEKPSTESSKTPVQIPPDVIIVPYDPEKPEVESDQIYVPYARYLELKKQAEKQGQTNQAPPAEYAWSEAAYTVTLGGDELTIKGTIEFETFTEGPVSIPLTLSNGVITRADVDGKQAQLRVETRQPEIKTQAKSGKAAAQQASPAANNAGSLVLVTRGRGRKKLQLELSFPTSQAGAWKRVTGKLPAAPAARIELDLPEEGAELDYRIAGRTVKFVASANEKTARLPVATDGQVDFSWRGKVSSARVDQNLSLNSTALFDVRNDGLHLVWHLDFRFRGNKRTSFELELPKDFSVVRVYGPNIRGWQMRQQADSSRLEVALLSEAENASEFTVELSNRKLDLSVATSFPMPTVVVPDAAIHSGQITVRKSDSLDLQTDTMIGISRIDTSEARQVRPKGEPLFNPAIFQAFEFSRTPFSVAIRCRPKERGLNVRTLSLVDIRQKTAGLDTQLICSSNSPVHSLNIRLPLDLEIQRIVVPCPYRKAITRTAEHQNLRLFLATGLEGNFSLNIAGRLADHDESGQLPLPVVRVTEAVKLSGEIAVIAEPQLILETTDLINCENVLLSRVRAWLNDRNRERSRLAIVHNSGDYSGRLKITRKNPVVSVSSVTNVNVTLRSIEESVMINYGIRDAGINQVTFDIPARFKDARFRADLVQEKSLVPLGDANAPDAYRVTLTLQDYVIGEYRILLELDRGLSSEKLAAPIPAFDESVNIVGRFVTLQNSGFDELVIPDHDGLSQLDRRQKPFRDLRNLTGDADIRQAYVVDSNAASPTLNYQTRRRQRVQTVGASIGLSEIELSIDRSGGFRAEQSFYVDNRTEPFLEINVPENSRLWTVKVAGTPVKPIAVKEDSQSVRIPLIKTADGDTDFLVEIKYGGSLGRLQNLGRFELPFVNTVNVKVQATTVKLNLPEDYSYYNFDGTLGKSEEKLIEQARKSYQTALFSKLETKARNSKSELVRQRARQNLLLLNQFGDQGQVEAEPDETAEVQVDNRDAFNRLYEGQKLQLFGNSGNVANSYGGNFTIQNEGVSSGKSSGNFNSKWLDSNGLVNPKILEQNRQNTRFNAPAFQGKPGMDAPNQPARKPDKSETDEFGGFGGMGSGGKGAGGRGSGGSFDGGMFDNRKRRDLVAGKKGNQAVQQEFQKQVIDNLNDLQEQRHKESRSRNSKDQILEKYRNQLQNRGQSLANEFQSRASRREGKLDQTRDSGIRPGQSGGQSGQAGAPATPVPTKPPVQTADDDGVDVIEAGGAAREVDFSGVSPRSLDVEFQHRGKTFLFQTTDGKLELQISVVENSLFGRGTNLLVLVGFVGFLGCLLWFFSGKKQQDSQE